MITLDKPFASLEEMFKTLKGMSANDVIELAKALGVEWKECPHHVGINRMRASMAMREKFFPGQRRKRKPQPWKKVPYEEMVKIKGLTACILLLLYRRLELNPQRKNNVYSKVLTGIKN